MQIIRPTFIVNKEVCARNIARMASVASTNGLRFRPHFKTHQSTTIGEWFREAGVTAITVSSVSMANYFAENGWSDITIAFPVNILEIEAINHLAARVSLNLLVENEVSLMYLSKNLSTPAGVYIEIDTGHHRSGIEVVKTRRIDQLLEIIKIGKKLIFKGFLSHSGQTYSARTVDEIKIRHADALMKMRSLKKHYLSEWPALEISLGDTPACSVCDNFDGVDEIRPGNFIFYDLMQLQLGACGLSDIGAKLLCPVVAKQIMRNEVIVYGGAVHLSKEFLLNNQGKRSYGAVMLPVAGEEKETTIRQTRVAALSQEHGILRGPFDEINAIQIGQILEIIPIHSCLTADLAGYYQTSDGVRIGKMSK